jgi:transcription initiation factor TFIIE subunit alpha
MAVKKKAGKAKRKITPLRARKAKKAGKMRGIKKIKRAPLATPRKTSASAQKEKMNQVWKDVLLRDPRVRKWLVQAIGENAIHVIQEFEKEMSDEDIAKKSNIRASDVRVVLNKLHSHGLASYSRSRDKNSGWYSYVWKLDSQHALELAQEVEKLERGAAGSDNAQEIREYYYCPEEGVKVKFVFEVAAANNFRCANCGAMLKYLEPGKEAK